MKNVLIWITKAVFSAICSVAILSVFCLLYNYEGVHIKTESEATDYNWESNQLKSTMKEGFSWLHVDKYGYNNVKDNSKKPDILLMGSSHVEGLQVKKIENMGYLLDKSLENLSVYNIGMSGHTFYRCVDNLENAVNKYQPQKYVVIVIDEITLSEQSMLDVVNDKAVPIPSYSSGLMYTAQKIPFIKSAYGQLSEWISLDDKDNVDTDESEPKAEYNPNTQSTEPEEDTYSDVLSKFLDKAKESLDASCKLIIAFQPSQSLDLNGNRCYQADAETLNRFSLLCKEKQIEFCNLSSTFEKLYTEERVLAHGFSNTAVGAGHLNKYGHRVIADKIAELIIEMEKKQ